MNLLVTAGNTQVPINRVRVITNSFTGRTGATIAVEAYRRGHAVTLLTSQPEAVVAVGGAELPGDGPHWRCMVYRSFQDLQALMASRIGDGGLDAVIHAAAVSDYEVAGIFAPAAGTSFDAESCVWHGEPAELADRAAGKVKSDEPELWLRLTRTPKLVDRIRRDWGFAGVLVKFKLEVDVDDAELRLRAERSRLQSAADLMVANTLDGANAWALVGGADEYVRVGRPELAGRLLDEIAGKLRERSHG